MMSVRAMVAPIAALLLATAGVQAHAQQAPDSNGAPAYPGDNSSQAPIVLKQPDQPSSEAPIHLHMPEAPASEEIHLHMPAKHVAQRKKRAKVASTEGATAPSSQPAPATPDATAAPDVAQTLNIPSKPTPPRHVKKAADATPPAPPTAASSETAGRTPTDETLATAVPFTFNPNPPSKPAPAARMAKATPPPQQTANPAEDVGLSRGLTRQSQIIFAPGAPDPSSDAVDAIKGLAGPLNAALAVGASRIQLVAYGGSRGDHSSDARRLSLKRALIIRQLLIDGGVPSDRIDVRAMGGATDSAAADRVDVFTKA